MSVRMVRGQTSYTPSKDVSVNWSSWTKKGRRFKIPRVSAPLHILVNMSFQWSDTKDLGSSGSEENGDSIGLRRLGGGTFGVVYLHTGVRGLVYLLTPGLIPYRSSLESLKSVAQSMDAKLSGTNTVSFSRFIKHSAPLGMPSSRQSLPSSTHQLT